MTTKASGGRFTSPEPATVLPATPSDPAPRGVEPDPSIPRGGDDHDTTNSTAERYPGVRNHHFRDRDRAEVPAGSAHRDGRS